MYRGTLRTEPDSLETVVDQESSVSPLSFPVTPLTATATDTTLSDDWILTADVLVDSTSPTPVATFSRVGDDGIQITEALVVTPPTVQNGPTSLVHLYSDADSDSGWSTAEVSGGAGVTEVAAGTHTDGEVHAFFVTGGSLQHSVLGGDGWISVGSYGQCAGLRTVVWPNTNRLAAYGVTPKGDLLLVQPSGTQWQPATVPFSGALAGVSPLLCPTYQNNWVAGAVVNDQFWLWSGEGTQVGSGPQKVTAPTPVTDVIAAYPHQRSAMFMLVDAKGNVYANVGFSDVFVQIENADVVAGDAVVGVDGLLHVYGVNGQGLLSVSHQTGWSDDGPTFASAIPLDRGVGRVVTNRSAQSATALLAVGTDASLRMHAQDPDTRRWHARRAQTSATTAYQVPRYRTEITVLDFNNAPVPGVELSITAETAVALWAGGSSSPVDSTTPATYRTDSLGRLTVATLASGLHTPELTVSGGHLTTSVTAAPAGGVHDYLAGKRPLNQLGTFGPAVLQAARKPNGDLLCPALSQAKPPVTATAAASAITNSIRVGQAKTGAEALAAGAPAAFAVNLRDPSRPAYLEFASAEEATTHFEGLREQGLLGDPWDDFVHFAQDVWNGIKNAAITIGDFVVDTVKQVADFTVYIGEEIKHLTQVAIGGLEQAASIVQGVFHALEAAIADVIEWLKATFQWADIWETKTALQSALGRIPTYLQGVIENQASQFVDKFFDNLKSQVHTQFTAMKGKFPAGTSLSDMVTQVGPPATLGRTPPVEPPGATRPVSLRDLSARPLFATADGVAVTPGSFHSSGQHNWLLDKIQSYLLGVPELPDLDVDTVFNTLHGKAQEIESEITEAFASFRRAFIVGIQDPKDFPTLGVRDLLDGCEEFIDAVLDAMDAIVQALLALADAVLEGLGTLLNAPLQIPLVTPLINEIYKLVFPGRPPLPSVSIADVFCLVAAIPLTLVYKLTKGWDAQLFPGGNYPAFPAAAFLSDAVGDRAWEAPDDQEQVAAAIHFCLVGTVAVWALYDTVIDAATAGGGEIPFPLSVIDIVFPFAAQILAWPSEDGVPAPLPLEKPGEKAAFANWMLGWMYPLVDGASLTMAQFPDGSAGRRLLRSWEPTGKVITSILGGLNLITGVLETTLANESAGRAAANVLTPLPKTMQFMMLSAEEGETLGLAPLLKLVLDFFCGEGAAVALAAGD